MNWVLRLSTYRLALWLTTASLVIGTGGLATQTDAATALKLERSFALPFPASDMAWDSNRNRLYLTDGAMKRVVTVNLTNGSVVAAFEFSHTTEALALRPDGKMLYVAMVTQPHNNQWEDNHEGYIGVIDLEIGTMIKEFRVTIDPYDLLATNSGWLIISDGSGQTTQVTSFDSQTERQISALSVRQASRLAMHPGQRGFYATTSAASLSGSSTFTHYAFNPASGEIVKQIKLVSFEYSQGYTPDGRVFVDPTGENLITHAGTVLTSSETPAEDMKPVRGLEGGAVEAISFDMAHRAVFTIHSGAKAEQAKFAHYSPTYELVGTYALTNRSTAFSAIGSSVFCAAVSPIRTTIDVYRNPAVGWEVNQPPLAEFSLTPAPTTLEEIQFDARATRDDTDSTAELLYRWDWEGDGAWDTVFTNAPAIRHRYYIPGATTARLEVMDHFGSIGRAEKQFNISLGADVGLPGRTNVAYDLPFVPSDVGFDIPRQAAFLTDTVGKRLVRLNLTSGFIEREFAFAHGPKVIAVTPNGKRMYVTLPIRRGFDLGGSLGQIAEFDLEAGAHLRQYEIDYDFFDMVATDSGWLVFTSGSGQWSPQAIASLNVKTGKMATNHVVSIAFGELYPRARLALHPNQTVVYACDTEIRPPNLRHCTFDSVTGGVSYDWFSPHQFTHPLGRGVYVHPEGWCVLSGGGTVLSSSLLQQFDLRFLQALPVSTIEGVAFNVQRNLMAVASDASLTFFNSTNFNTITSYSMGKGLRWVNLAGKEVVAVSVSQTNAIVQRKRFPALNLEENLPPSVTLTVPNTLAVRGTPPAAQLEAVAHDEDGNIARVEFYDSDTLLAAVTNAPYNFTWRVASSGVRDLKAIAFDNLGSSSTSRAAQVRLDFAPSVSLLLPANDKFLVGPGELRIEADATDIDDGISRLDFLLNRTVVGSRTERPYSITVTNPPGGFSRILAVAVDQAGVMTTSAPVFVTIGGIATDSFGSSLPMQGSEFTLSASNASATKQASEPHHGGNSGGKSVWWSWRAHSAGNVLIGTEGSSFDTLLSVYTGSSVTNLQLVAANDNDPADRVSSRVKFRTAAASTYHIAVDGKDRASGILRLHLVFTPSSVSFVPNDLLVDAIPITGIPVVVTGSNSGGTKENQEPNHAGEAGGRSVWWIWTAPQSAAVHVDTSGSTFDTLLAVYEGNTENVALLRPIASNDDGSSASVTSKVRFDSKIGTAYLMAVDGYLGATGNIRLAIKTEPNVPPIGIHAGVLTIQPDGQGRYRLLIKESSAKSVALLTSEDLINWIAIETNSVAVAAAQFQFAIKPQDAQRFYRVRTVE